MRGLIGFKSIAPAAVAVSAAIALSSAAKTAAGAGDSTGAGAMDASAAARIEDATDAAANPQIAAPVIPDRSFSIIDFGAVGDGKTLNTSAISRAIAACSMAGGG